MAFDATDFIPAKVDPLTITDPRERLKYLAGFLRELPDARFDMAFLYSKERADTWALTNSTPGTLVRGCGTAACIAGWALAVFTPRARHTGSDRAGAVLGLDGDQQSDLFMPSGFSSQDFATPRQAAQVIDHLLLTGEVDWSVAGVAS